MTKLENGDLDYIVDIGPQLFVMKSSTRSADWRHVMLKNILIVGALSALLFVGLAGVAVAGEGDYKNILGTDEFVFAAPGSTEGMAIMVQDQDQEVLSIVGTEAGNWEYRFTPADQKASGVVAEQGGSMDAKCSNC